MTDNQGHSTHPTHGGHESPAAVSRSAGGRGRPAVRGPLHGVTTRVITPFAKKHKFIFMGIIGILGFLLIFLAVKVSHLVGGEKDHKPAEKGGGTLAVNVSEVKPEHFVDPMVAVGTIQGGNEIPLRFESDGIIEFFEFREGDKVRKGDVVARLNQRDTFLKLKKTRLKLEQMEMLYAIGGVSLSELEAAKVDYDLAASEMEKTVLRCPRGGILGDKDAEVGEFVTPSKKIATLMSIENVMVVIGVIEKEIDRIFPGQKVVLTVDTYPNVEFTGKVVEIDPMVDPVTRTMKVKSVLSNDGGLLLPGMFARVRITIFEQDNALVVPNDAVEKTAGGSKLYVVNKDNVAEEREVDVSYVSTQFSLISKGIEPGDLVITQRPNDLKAGAAVKIIEKN